ncbi:MAG TPA: cyclase family protein [Cyclobacteriaceae bacterium]
MPGEDNNIRLAGHAILRALGVRDTLKVENLESNEGLYYLDSYFTLFNHTGPRVDAPVRQTKKGAALDAFSLDQFIGQAKFLNYRDRAWNLPISLEDIKNHHIVPDDIVIAYVGFKIPDDTTELPAYTALTPDAAEYLASLPIKAYATDAPGADNLQRTFDLFEKGETDFQKVLPVHHAFLSRNIPLIEGLHNLGMLTDENDFIFVGFPLKIAGRTGDAASMRAAALIYQ